MSPSLTEIGILLLDGRAGVVPTACGRFDWLGRLALCLVLHCLIWSTHATQRGLIPHRVIVLPVSIVWKFCHHNTDLAQRVIRVLAETKKTNFQ